MVTVVIAADSSTRATVSFGNEVRPPRVVVSVPNRVEVFMIPEDVVDTETNLVAFLGVLTTPHPWLLPYEQILRTTILTISGE